jgi:hypothetical protein
MKSLRDIVSITPGQTSSAPNNNDSTLKGVKKSKVVDGSTGDDPGVDYSPKPGEEQKLVKLHKTEKHDDRVGNGDDVQQGSKIKYSMDDTKMSKFGYKKGKDKAVYEAASCNHTPNGKNCPVHGDKACPSKGLREVVKKTTSPTITPSMNRTADTKIDGGASI